MGYRILAYPQLTTYTGRKLLYPGNDWQPLYELVANLIGYVYNV